MKLLILLVSVFGFAQQTKVVDFKTINASLEINPIKRNVVGNATYTFAVLSKIDTIRIDAQKMQFSNVKINGETVPFVANKKQLLLFKGFKNGENTLTFDYEAFPTQAMYFVNWDFTKTTTTPEEVNGQIWTQGQGRYTSNWLPSFDDVNEKVIFGLAITFQKSFQVVSNGVLLNTISKGENLTWCYQMDKPMSSYLLMLAIGHFNAEKSVASSGVPLEYYYEKEDSSRIEPTYRFSKKVFDFLEKKIGVPYPWEIYRQIPVRDFLYAGMENTTTTLFSRDFVVDSVGYNDRNYININAHELAHHWFGDLVTAQSGKDHWLQEGFATYFALLAEKEVFGEDYFYNRLYEMAMQIKQASKRDSIPVLNEKASSLSFYQKGAWALHVVHEALGDATFDLVIKNYLETFAYKNVTTDDFLEQVALVSDFDVKSFRQVWLEQTAFPEEDVLVLLQKNEAVQAYLKLRSLPLDIEKDREEILKIMRSELYYPIKELLVYQSASKPFELREPLLKAALQTKDVKVRQAVASSITSIPENFREQYETLLDDKSYETQEIALFNLWKQFSQHQKRYLERAQDWVGFENKNLRLLYLSLSFLTYEDAKEKNKAYSELLSYTGTNNDSNLQQNALERLLNLKIYNEAVFKSLAYGTGNHRWQFVKFSKDTIRKLIKELKYREVFVKIKDDLPIREKTQLQRLLDEK